MVSTLDAYTPREIAHKIETLGVTKARNDTLSLLVLAVLAGAFIALGAYSLPWWSPVRHWGSVSVAWWVGWRSAWG
jgi:hypothetical protein